LAPPARVQKARFVSDTQVPTQVLVVPSHVGVAPPQSAEVRQPTHLRLLASQ
jgi:hypothetical protein